MKTAAVLGFLFLATGLFYHQSLGFWWTWDDTVILRHAWSYAPWQYFLVPEIWQIMSGASLTPWVSFSFDLDLAAFGADPQAFFAHQLLSLWLTASASFLLLRLYVRFFPALFGSLLFLFSPPAMAASHQLMARHYLEGLLFAILALYAWVLAMRVDDRRHSRWLLASSLLAYALAMTAKEVFVPLLLILPLLPEADWKRRLRASIPYVLLVALYCVWRFFMLKALIGGFQDTGQSLLEWQVRLPLYVMGMLFGSGSYQTVAILLLLFLLVCAVLFGSRSRRLIPATMVLIGLPLLPVILLLVNQHALSQRMVVLPAWAISMAIALIVGRLDTTRTGKKKLLLASTMLASAILAVFWVRQSLVVDTELQTYRKFYEASGRFIHQATAEQALTEAGDWYAVGALWLRQRQSQDSPTLIFDWIQLNPDDVGKKQFFQYQADCSCIQDITGKIPKLLQRWQDQQQKQALSVRMSYRDHQLNWEFHSDSAGTYQIIDSGSFGRVPVPAKGQMRARYPEDVLRFHVRHDSTTGRITYSPLLELDFTRPDPEVHWQTRE